MDVDLGYYDQQKKKIGIDHNKRKKRKLFFTGLIGAIVGALLVILAVPTLSNYGLLPYSVAANKWS